MINWVYLVILAAVGIAAVIWTLISAGIAEKIGVKRVRAHVGSMERLFQEQTRKNLEDLEGALQTEDKIKENLSSGVKHLYNYGFSLPPDILGNPHKMELVYEAVPELMKKYIKKFEKKEHSEYI